MISKSQLRRMVESGHATAWPFITPEENHMSKLMDDLHAWFTRAKNVGEEEYQQVKPIVTAQVAAIKADLEKELADSHQKVIAWVEKETPEIKEWMEKAMTEAASAVQKVFAAHE
jgi:hypothetical protein